MQRDHQAIRRILIVTLVLNAIAAGVKLSVGILTGALSLIADGLDTLSDTLSNVIGLLATRISQQPPDEDHPYGHRKYETVAALLIAALLFVVAWELLAGALNRLFDPQPPDVTGWSIAALLFGGILQGVTGWWEVAAGRRLHSEILIADGRHAQTSMLVSGAVLIGLGMVSIGMVWADAVIAIGIALWIGRIGVQTIRENIPALVDEAPLHPASVGRIVGSVQGVESFHRIRSRGTLDMVAIDLHVRVAPHLTMQAGNAIGDEVRRRLLNLPNVDDVTVHIEAERGPESAADLYAAVQLLAEELGLTIHEFWVHEVDNRQHLHLHVGVSPSLILAEAHDLVDRLERSILQRQPHIQGVHTHIELATVAVLPSARISQQLHRQVEQTVVQVTATIPDLSHPHDIVVHQVEGQLFVNLEAFVDGSLFIAEAHQRSDQLAQALRQAIPNVGEVLVHLEPYHSFSSTRHEDVPAKP